MLIRAFGLDKPRQQGSVGLMSFLNGQFELKESQHLEFKEAAGGLPLDVWESYSAFANTEGGEIVLGVHEDRSTHKFTLAGVPNADEMIDEIWKQANNSQLVGRNILLPDDVVSLTRDGMEFVVMTVPRAEREEKPITIRDKKKKKDIAFVRRGTGDCEATENDLALMRYDNARNADRGPLDRFSLTALCPETIRRYRQVFAGNKPGSPWNSDPDIDFLYHIGAVAKGRGGELVPTMAGLLAFGYEYEITSWRPSYLLDYREETGDARRWEDRVVSQSGDWSGNVVDFYFMIIERLKRRFKMPFSTDSTGVRHGSRNPITEAVNEAVANALVHAYYGNDACVRVLVSDDCLRVSNSGNMLVDRDVAIAGGVSDTRNPTLMRIMSFIGATDRAGSGIEMIWSVWGDFFSAPPMISESHGPSETLLVLPIELHQDIASDSPEGEQRIRHGENDVLKCFESTGAELGVGDVMTMLPGISKRTAQKRLKTLFEKGEVARRKEGSAFVYFKE